MYDTEKKEGWQWKWKEEGYIFEWFINIKAIWLKVMKTYPNFSHHSEHMHCQLLFKERVLKGGSNKQYWKKRKFFPPLRTLSFNDRCCKWWMNKCEMRKMIKHSCVFIMSTYIHTLIKCLDKLSFYFSVHVLFHHFNTDRIRIWTGTANLGLFFGCWGTIKGCEGFYSALQFNQKLSLV